MKPSLKAKGRNIYIMCVDWKILQKVQEHGEGGYKEDDVVEERRVIRSERRPGLWRDSVGQNRFKTQVNDLRKRKRTMKLNTFTRWTYRTRWMRKACHMDHDTIFLHTRTSVHFSFPSFVYLPSHALHAGHVSCHAKHARQVACHAQHESQVFSLPRDVSKIYYEV